MAQKQCYNCGKLFENRDLTKEHIPPKCFSDVYSDEFKMNRLTVPCCNDCNNNLSKTDTYLRDVIAIVKDGRDGNAEFLRKAMKSVLDDKSGNVSKTFDHNGLRVSMSTDVIDETFLKCHKGLFYDKYGYAIDGEFDTKVFSKLVGEAYNNPLNQVLRGIHMSRRDLWKISGHEDIFFGSLLPIKQNGDKWEIAENLEEAFAVCSLMGFHGLVEAVGISVRKGHHLHPEAIRQRKEMN